MRVQVVPRSLASADSAAEGAAAPAYQDIELDIVDKRLDSAAEASHARDVSGARHFRQLGDGQAAATDDRGATGSIGLH